MNVNNLAMAAKQPFMAQQAMMVNVPRRFYDLKRLHVFDHTNQKNSISGINATVFGGTSALGMVTGSMLTRIGSTCIYPYRQATTIWDIKFKELKPTADMGYKAYVKLQNFANEKEIAHVIRD